MKIAMMRFWVTTQGSSTPKQLVMPVMVDDDFPLHAPITNMSKPDPCGALEAEEMKSEFLNFCQGAPFF